jgi:hypothetical protein
MREFFEAGFDVYTFSNPASRDRYLAGLLTSGVEFETHAFEEVGDGYGLYCLAVKRTSLTFKQRLTKGHTCER